MDDARRSKSKASRIHRTEKAAAAVSSLSYDLLAVKSFIFDSSSVGSCFDSVIDVSRTIKMIL